MFKWFWLRFWRLGKVLWDQPVCMELTMLNCSIGMSVKDCFGKEPEMFAENVGMWHYWHSPLCKSLHGSGVGSPPAPAWFGLEYLTPASQNHLNPTWKTPKPNPTTAKNPQNQKKPTKPKQKKQLPQKIKTKQKNPQQTKRKGKKNKEKKKEKRV